MNQGSPARQGLLEGFARRLAVARDADAYALRGGMLVRSWLPQRRARDLDVVCSLPFSPRPMRARLREVLATQLADGVVFDAERFRIDSATRDRALKLFVLGRADGARAEITVDLQFGLDVWPRAARRELLTSRGAVEMWTCSPEMVIGTKLAVTSELGRGKWRPKDLADLWLLTKRRAGESFGVLGEAIERGFARATRELADVQQLFVTSWWRDADTAMRWARFAARRPWVPIELDTVLSELHANLSPLARLP